MARNSFVNTVILTLAGEEVKITTNAWDQLSAESSVGAGVMEHPVALGMHVYYAALKRQHPEHPTAKTFRAFVDVLEATEDEDDDTPLDPTLPADTGG